MAALTKKSRTSKAESSAIPAIRALVLVRIACSGGATRAQIVRDLAALVSHKLSPAEWREAVGEHTGELLSAALCCETRGRLTATSNGHEAVESFLGSKATKSSATWADVRTGRLIAKALGLSRIGPTILKALAKPDGLRAVVLQKAFGLPTRGNQNPTQLRGALALVALERAFGNKVKTGLGAGPGAGFSAKAGRLLAGQLSTRPRDFGTDVQLVTYLAAEAVDARQTEPEALRSAILRSFATRGLAESTKKVSAPSKLTPAANDKGIPGAAAHAIRRPGPEEFARLVQDAAGTCAEGWSGNRKAMISDVWGVIEQRHPGWNLSKIEFKCMLAEAHRAGLLMLASADLKNKQQVEQLEASAITYMNTVWHLVRLTDDA